MTMTSKGRASGRPPVGSLLRSASSRPLQTYRPSTSLVKSVNCAVLAVMVLLDVPRIGGTEQESRISTKIAIDYFSVTKRVIGRPN